MGQFIRTIVILFRGNTALYQQGYVLTSINMIKGKILSMKIYGCSRVDDKDKTNHAIIKSSG